MAAIALGMELNVETMQKLCGSNLYGLYEMCKSPRDVLNSCVIEPKLAYIAMFPAASDKVKEQLLMSFSIDEILKHAKDPSYFLPKNSMPVEKEMGLDKPGSLQRIIALEKMVKELKKELESVKSLDNRI